LNNILRGIFIAPALERIIKEKDVDTITRCLEIVKASNARIIDLYQGKLSKFDDDILIKLANSLPLTLTEFRLSSSRRVTVNRMNACLEKIVGCPKLVKLDLSHNDIDDVGAKAIADALKVNHSLKTLDLDGNKIDDDGSKHIADALKVN
jgi:Leucine-rich repeat (LRR) protein